MWTPTHVQLTVKRAKGLLFKGKNNTNDAFVTISLGKEKYQTSVKERSTDPVEWNEECELPIPKQGNKAEVVLTVLHRNFIGDQFLGTVSIPLSDFDHYEQPKNRWVSLKSKPGPEKNKPRGDLEFRLGFTVKSGFLGSYSDLSKKDSTLRASFGQLSKKASSVGGSLLSLGGKDKKGGLKGLAKAVGDKVSTLPGRGKKKHKDDSFGTIPEQQVFNSNTHVKKLNPSDADPGVVSDEEDEFRFEELSHKSSNSSLSVSQVALSTPKDGSLENLGGGEFMRRNYATPPPIKPSRNTVPTETVPIDEWDKFFSKPNNSIKLPPGDDLKFSPVTNRKPLSLVEPDQPEPEPKPKKEPNVDKIQVKEKVEPVPKPRQLLENKPEMIIKEEKTSEGKKEEKKKELKEKTKSLAKGTIASIFSPKSKEPEENQSPKGTPIGITNPIRQRDTNHSETRLPKEVLKKFEGKTRDDLVEMIVRLQNTVEHQKLKMGDMEDYIDNLLVRVMENKPTLLQSPYVSVRHPMIKSNKWSF